MTAVDREPPIDASEVAAVLDPLADPIWRSLRARVGEPAMFDAHTHIGVNDPDGHSQTAEQLLDALDRLDARGVTFPMHETDGYAAANDEVIAAAAGSAGKLVAFCRVDPHRGALAEATRALGAGARGIKLHPRAEGFTLADPAVRDLVALAHERRLPILIHAGRGIPALGPDALALASEFAEARLILAHAAVSDLAWLWRELPRHQNLFVDTAWWTPGDMIALFTLVPPGRILFASDSPYAPPLTAAAQHFLYARQAGLGSEALRLIAGAQLERLLAGEEPVDAPPAAGEAGPLDPLLERLVNHLSVAIGRLTGLADPAEPVALARLACAVERGPLAARCALVLDLIDRAEDHLPAPTGVRWGIAAQILALAIAVARTPDVALGEHARGDASRDRAEHGREGVA